MVSKAKTHHKYSNGKSNEFKYVSCIDMYIQASSHNKKYKRNHENIISLLPFKKVIESLKMRVAFLFFNLYVSFTLNDNIYTDAIKNSNASI